MELVHNWLIQPFCKEACVLIMHFFFLLQKLYTNRIYFPGIVVITKYGSLVCILYTITI